MSIETLFDNANVAITVCDGNGKIVFMNNKAGKVFEKHGGTKLIGSSLLDCHPEPAKSKLVEMLKAPKSNAYTIEKNGVKKLIYQAPINCELPEAGLIEISMELPPEIPHFIRK